MKKVITALYSAAQILATILFVCAGLYGCMYMLDDAAAARERTEQQYNCKYDYNDLCYTREERPWLFD